MNRFLNRAWAFLKDTCERFNVWKFGRWEVAFMRIFFALLVFQTMPLGTPFSNWTYEKWPELGSYLHENDEALRPPLPPISQLLPQSEAQLTFDDQPIPNGLAQRFDFTIFSEDKFVNILPWIVIPCLLIYMSGYGLWLALPVLTFVSIGSRTLANSQGAIHHGFQIVSIVLLAQTIVVVFGAIYRLVKRRPFIDRRSRSIRDYMIHYSLVVVLAFYVIAGVIKVIKSDGEWVQNSHLIGIQLIKTDRQNYYNNLDGETYGNEVRWAEDMLEHPNLARAFMSCGLLLELFAFLALYNRGMSLLIGTSLVAFHQLNDAIMHLTFHNNEKLVWIFLINIPFWVGWLWRQSRKQKAEQETGATELEASPA